MITLTENGNTVTLPDDLVWKDEMSWSAVAQSQQRSLTGALVIQESAKVKGRRITLHGDADAAWIDRATLQSIRVLRDTVDAVLTLDFHGATFDVRFDHSSGVAITATPVIECSDPDSASEYYITLKFLTV